MSLEQKSSEEMFSHQKEAEEMASSANGSDAIEVMVTKEKLGSI
jgi:hypothetical protein